MVNGPGEHLWRYQICLLDDVGEQAVVNMLFDISSEVVTYPKKNPIPPTKEPAHGDGGNSKVLNSAGQLASHMRTWLVSELLRTYSEEGRGMK